MASVANHAKTRPDHPAVIFDNGERTVSYRDLERSSRRMAHLLRALGVEPGDAIAVMVGNEELFFDTYWAAMRLGIYFTPVNWHLQDAEIAYIVDNCDARVFLASSDWEKTVTAAQIPESVVRLSSGGDITGYRRIEEALADAPEDAELPDQLEGQTMLYSSGTTGFPKGVRTRLSGLPAGHESVGLRAQLSMGGLFQIGQDSRYICPAPLYHAAPLAFTMSLLRLGGTAVVMSHFDPEDALRVIQDQKVTASQWVPTHFRRMLHLPDEVRARYDVSSLQVAIHAAAPCPIPIKRKMIEWWGPVILEYYAGTEGGGTIIRSEEWMDHPGSVGKHWAGGEVHILDEDGNEVTEPTVEGAIYFDAPEQAEERFRYYKDDEKTAGSYRGSRFTLGDIGYKDADGYLFLTDRKSNMIISGGANIYPQEVENHLASHDKVEDVAVIGVPNEDFGEEVKAVVIPRDRNAAGPDLESELIDYCREGIAHFKCPRTIDFVDELPRTPTGKLVKRKLRDQYWADHESHLV
ncbi:MAG: acyl-CoA synthetase [Deltaproteobacteria bacterium]|nr:acyl-CoA synthetase [Deltaproteobacteria bacterium]MBW2413519.1 acyl-CoA synthetase [Deltaproteobacteria bacterium]